MRLSRNILDVSVILKNNLYIAILFCIRMLQELSKNHQEWLQIALHICKDSYLAQDLVQEMYLKLNRYPPKKEINNFYIYVTIKHIYYDHLKEEKQYTEINERILKQPEDETHKAYHAILDRLEEELNDLYWYDRELLLKKLEKSPRVIQMETKINHRHIYRNCQKTEEELKSKLEQDFKQYLAG
jgi:DNA-directed RNA polymerase specialized sigma24 family protein